jgi:hypothetical protein
MRWHGILYPQRPLTVQVRPLLPEGRIERRKGLGYLTPYEVFRRKIRTSKKIPRLFYRDLIKNAEILVEKYKNYEWGK